MGGACSETLGGGTSADTLDDQWKWAANINKKVIKRHRVYSPDDLDRMKRREELNRGIERKVIL